MTNTFNHAKRELDILSKSCPDPDNRPIIEPFIPELLALCEKFGESGQSGGSAPFVASALSSAVKHLCLQENICPIMGTDDEWNDVSESMGRVTCFQNNRLSSIFKDKDGRCDYINAIVWKGQESWDTFTGSVEGISSSQYIKSFPFKPKTFYIDVIRVDLPEDWEEEPYIEGKGWYDTKEYEETGVKNWHKEKYKYVIKDKKQLKKVFKYYDER